MRVCVCLSSQQTLIIKYVQSNENIYAVTKKRMSKCIAMVNHFTLAIVMSSFVIQLGWALFADFFLALMKKHLIKLLFFLNLISMLNVCLNVGVEWLDTAFGRWFCLTTWPFNSAVSRCYLSEKVSFPVIKWLLSFAVFCAFSPKS